jgi:hypothetical protein
MTEAKWLACTEPYQMLDFLPGKVSGRKLRLFACACCRQGVWPLLSDRRSRKAVEVAERFAEGAADRVALRAAWMDARVAAQRVTRNQRAAIAAAAAAHRSHRCGRAAAGRVFSVAYYGEGAGLSREEQRQAHLVLLRCVFGNPFRRAAVDPAWLAWNGGCVVRLATAAYDERELPGGRLDPARLAILADALEDAGCDDATMPAHLREPGPHVRGCWVVDLLLGKE